MSDLAEQESNTGELRADVVVIGSGPGGYVCAIRLGQLGKKVMLIEKEKIGGVCLNVGCIPSKALITASKLVKNVRNASRMGISAQVSVDLTKLQQWKQGVVDRLTGGVALLCRANGVKILHGSAQIMSTGQISVTTPERKSVIINCTDIVVATGSSPIDLPDLRLDGTKIISSTEALALNEIPRRILIVGGGVIGLEIGMAFANLFGTELVIVELLDQLLPGVDLELVNLVAKSLQRMNAHVHLKSKVKSATVSGKSVNVVYETENEGEHSILVDYVLVSIGRKPNSKDLGLQKIGVVLNEKGFIKVNKEMRTNLPHIFAIGDVVGGPLLAHKASKEGTVAAEVIAGLKSSFDNIAMPSTIFTDPEIAIVGLAPHEALKEGIEIVSGKFPFSANGKALASSESDGFVKIISDKQSGLLLGIGIVGAEASDLVSEATLAIELGAKTEDIALTIHPHPTLPEAIAEAAENALGRAIHIQNRMQSS